MIYLSSCDDDDALSDYALPRCPRHDADCLGDIPLIDKAPSSHRREKSKSYLARAVDGLFKRNPHLHDSEVGISSI